MSSVNTNDNNNTNNNMKPTLYYDDVCMNALTAYTLIHVTKLQDKFNFKHVSLRHGEQMNSEYVSKFPLHHIPALEVNSNGLKFDESGTILRYIANKYPTECSQFYPRDNVEERALIERCMDWRNTEYMPMLSMATYGILWGVPYPTFTNPDVVTMAVQQVTTQLEYLATHLLCDDKKFLAGRDVPSIAEFHIIPSIATIRPFHGTKREMKIPKRVEKWIQDFYEYCPDVLDIQNQVQIPYMESRATGIQKQLSSEEETTKDGEEEEK